jgi:hypothetical protein
MVYFLYLYTHSFKSCFELKMTIEKANRVSCFFRYCPIIRLYILLLNSSISPEFLWITKDVLLFRMIYFVCLCTHSFKSCFEFKSTIKRAIVFYLRPT